MKDEKVVESKKKVEVAGKLVRKSKMKNNDKVETGAQADDVLEKKLNNIVDVRFGKKKNPTLVHVPSLLPTSTPKLLLEDKLNKVIDGRLGKKRSLTLVHVPSLLPTGTPKLFIVRQKCDDAYVTTEYWLHWLNEGLGDKLSQEEWDSCVTVIQENFLLLRWRRNVTSSF